MNHPFVILDEPFSGIEPLYVQEIKDLLIKTRKEKGIIISDHNYRDILEIASKVILIRNGICKKIENREELHSYGYLPHDSQR